MAIFELKILRRTAAFGENAHQERSYIATALRRAASHIESGAEPQTCHSLPEPGGLNPNNVSWQFGKGEPE